MEKILDIRGLDCANCAAKVERAIEKVEGVRSANLNFMAQKLFLELNDRGAGETLETVKKVVSVMEPGVTLSERPGAGGEPCGTVPSHTHFHIGRKVGNPACEGEAACACPPENRQGRQKGEDSAEKSAVRGHECGGHGHGHEGVAEGHSGEGENPSAGIGENRSAGGGEIPSAGIGENPSAGEGGPGQDHTAALHDSVQAREDSQAGREDGQGRELAGPRFRLIYAQLAVSAVLLLVSFFVGRERLFAWNNAKLWLCLFAYLVIGGEIVWKSVKSISRGRVFDENFLMAIASVGAFAVGDFPEAVGVMLFYRVGEMFQDFAVERSRRNIRSLMDLRPDSASVRREGEVLRVRPEEVRVGEVILVRAGERVPLDGVLLSKGTSVDNSALTGESLPREIVEGEEVLSGCINLTGAAEIRTTKVFGDSTVAKILDLVENAAAKKSRSENFITKFAKYYTPAVVAAALLLAFVPCLFLGFDQLSDWGYRALTFLVISCPCALVISVPLSFFGGIGGASRLGVLIKGSHNVEELAHAEIVVFDKTGTLTKGSFSVTKILPAPGVTEEELLRVCGETERVSNHPIAQSVLRAYGKQPKGTLEEVLELSGYGITALLDGKRVLVGNARLMEREGISPLPVAEPGTVVYAASEGRYLGGLLISDEVKPDSAQAVADLRSAGVKKIAMLTGDNRRAAQRVADELKLDTVYSELLPKDKVDRVEELLAEKSGKGKLLFVGDGINDAPVIARADVGIAMGGLGSDAAIEVADVVLMTDEPSKLARGIRQSRRTMRIVKQNIIFALAVKAAILVLGALGYASMWLAVFADVGVSVLAILNALRALRVGRKKGRETGADSRLNSVGA